jgi:hypothetical protein
VSGVLYERGGWWAPVAVGVVPLAIAAPFGSSLHQTASALLGFALLIAAIHRGDERRGLLTLPIVFCAHCALAIVLARLWPAETTACFPDGAEYWRGTLTWIQTGYDPEYDPANWVPEHLELAFVVGVIGYISLGLIPLFQGFHEVDLMNFYVGRLLAETNDTTLSLLLGWHPWSVMRGLAFSVLIYEVVAWSYRRLTATSGQGRGGLRLSRLGLAFGLLFADGLMKWLLLDPVRRVLAAGLSGELQ